MDDQELVAAIRETFPTLDKWRDALSEVIDPVPGSALASDDEAWPYMRESTLVSLGLASAREHLHAVRLLLEAGELFPAAASTLCRSALIGASLAVWMLEPDSQAVRLRRSLSLALEDYHRHAQFGADVMRLLPPEQIRPVADEQLDRLELRRSQVRSLLDDVGGAVAVNLTDDVIPAALEYAVPNPAQRGQMVVRWRAMSGAAHALTWHFYGYDSTEASDVDEGGVGRLDVGGDIERLAMDYFPPYHVAAAGWRLLHERAGLGQPSPG